MLGASGGMSPTTGRRSCEAADEAVLCTQHPLPCTPTAGCRKATSSAVLLREEEEEEEDRHHTGACCHGNAGQLMHHQSQYR